MNHTRFLKENHLPDWARRDIKVTKGDCVECVLHPPLSHCTNWDISFLWTWPLLATGTAVVLICPFLQDLSQQRKLIKLSDVSDVQSFTFALCLHLCVLVFVFSDVSCFSSLLPSFLPSFLKSFCYYYSYSYSLHLVSASKSHFHLLLCLPPSHLLAF